MKQTDIRKILVALGVAIILFIACNLLTACTGLPTLPAPTSTQALGVTQTPTPNVPLVTVTGDVFVRDSQGAAKGYLLNDSTVYALCSGEWCYLDGGLKFWRGCSSDNPYKLGCTSK
jgi:hypothetical protein